MKRLLAVLALAATPAAFAQTCPEKNLMYWQAFPAGGESDISARHQQFVLKKKCPSIETIIQYKPGVGGAVMWNQMNALPGDGLNIVGINLPHIVLAPFEGQVQYKTEDITPTYWFHYTPDALVVPESSSESSRSAARGSTRRTTPRTSASTRSSASRPSTCLSRAPAT